MPVIKPTCVRDLKLRVSLADVVSRVAALRKAGGARFKALCPFHQEKTPSFHLDADKGLYKCFGCGKAGDVITFVRETEQLNFTEAVEALGQRFGIVIEYDESSGGPSQAERSLRQELFDLHEQAADHFYRAFQAADATGEFFREYWTLRRRFTLELAGEFKIGAADEKGGGLADFLLRRKFSEEALRRCGLFFLNEGAPLAAAALRPRFRGRLMIPIRDHQGRVVAFTARQTDRTPADDPARDAKYVNSPETPIFSKGNLLFNLDRARSAVGDDQPFVLVEGQLDALRCWSVGLRAAVAPQGTSITESQLVLLRRYHARVECCFDGDAAGQKAALRLLPLALKVGLEVRFLAGAGAEKLDPDLLLLERGLAGYQELRRHAQGAMTFACRIFLSDPGRATAEERARAAEAVVEVIAASESGVVRTGLLRDAAGALWLEPGVLEREYGRLISRRQHRPYAPAGAAPAPAPAAGSSATPEHHLLMLCLHHEELGRPLSQVLPPEWIDTGHEAGALLNRLLNEFEHDAWSGREHLEHLIETPAERALLATLLFDASDVEDPLNVAVEGVRRLRLRALEPRLRQIELALANTRADIESDPISLLKERSVIQRRLREPLVLDPAV